jgi:hypothetical protein
MTETVHNVRIDSNKVIGLGLKLAKLSNRKSKGRVTRFLVLFVEKMLGGTPFMDNEAEVLAFYREWIDDFIAGDCRG